MILKPQPTDEILLQKYLLGQTSVEEQRAVEQRLLVEQDYFDQLVRAEEELIDQYVRGKLEGPGKEAFERYFLSSPERYKNVEFARAFHRYLLAHAEQSPPSEQSWNAWRSVREFALLCVAIVLAAALGMLWHKNTQLRKQLEQSDIQRAQAAQREKTLQQQLEQQQKELARLRQDQANPNTPANPPDSDLIALVLMPGISRDAGQAATAVVSPGKRRLQLELKIEDTGRGSYKTELQTVEGETIWARSGLKAQKSSHGSVVKIVLPTTLLHRSEYLVALSLTSPAGISEKVGTYYFRAVHE